MPGGFLAPRRAGDGGRDEFDESAPFNKPEWRLGHCIVGPVSTVNRSREGPSINDLIRTCGPERVPFLPFSSSPFVGKRGYGLGWNGIARLTMECVRPERPRPVAASRRAQVRDHSISPRAHEVAGFVTREPGFGKTPLGHRHPPTQRSSRRKWLAPKRF